MRKFLVKIRLILIVCLAIMLGSVIAYADTLYWDASPNADDPGIAHVQYRVYAGTKLSKMKKVDEVDGLSYKIPGNTPYGTFYQVTGFNTSGESNKSESIEYLNLTIPLAPGGIGIRVDQTVSFYYPMKPSIELPEWIYKRYKH